MAMQQQPQETKKATVAPASAPTGETPVPNAAKNPPNDAPNNTTPPTRTVKFPAGIKGAQMSEIERQIPVDEPPVLPVNAELGVIGKRTPRIDGRLKVTGAARY